jgi:hypothetical protein
MHVLFHDSRRSLLIRQHLGVQLEAQVVRDAGQFPIGIEHQILKSHSMETTSNPGLFGLQLIKAPHHGSSSYVRRTPRLLTQ